jgi:hypothetical protein
MTIKKNKDYSKEVHVIFVLFLSISMLCFSLLKKETFVFVSLE